MKTNSNATLLSRLALSALIALAALTAACHHHHGSDNGTGASSVSINSSSGSVQPGGTFTITWTTIDATACTASGAWSGSKGTSGSETITAPTAPGAYDYVLTCSGPGGSGDGTSTVTVAPASAPVVTFTSTPSSVQPGATFTLNWSASKATACTASGGADSTSWQGSKPTSGSATITAPSTPGSYGYILTCTGSGGSGVASVSEQVGSATPAPTVAVDAVPSTVQAGAAFTLNWSTTNATACTASGAWSGSKASSGSSTLNAPSNPGSYPYTLTCAGPGGSGTGTINLQVSSATTPTVSLSSSNPAVASGGVFTLSWSSTGADSCTASGGDGSASWQGSKPTSGSATITAPSTPGSYSYTLSCAGAGGSGVKTVSESVGAVPAPAVNLSLSPSTINSGNSATLSWSATNASSCTAGGAWSGTKATSGSASTGTINTVGTYSYTLSCTGAGGQGVDSVSLSVSAGATVPSVTINANPGSVPAGGSSTLSWSSTDADSCTASGAWSGNKAVSGTQVVGPIDTSGVYAYTLSCSGAGGTGSGTATVTVGTQSPPTVQVTIDPATIQPGQSATLSWSSTNATTCEASGAWSGTQAISGTVSTGTLATDGVYSYTLTCSGPQGSAADSAVLQVEGTAVTVDDCGIGRPSQRLLTPNATVAVATPGPLCLLCSISQPENVIDVDAINFATINVPIGLLALDKVSLTTTHTSGSFVSGSTAGFVLGNPNELLNLGLLQGITVDTLLNGSVQESAGASLSSPLRLDLLELLGIGTTKPVVYASFRTSKPFDALRVNDSSLASVLAQVDVYSACVANP